MPVTESTENLILEQLRLIRAEIASMKTSPTLGLVEAAQVLHIHKDTVREKVAAGVVPGMKVGRRWVFIEEDLLTFMREKYTPKVAPCPYTSKKAVKTGGCASEGLDARLERLIAEKRKKRTAK